MTHSIDEYRVDTPRLALSVRDHLGGEPALLALHGLASNARWWDLVAGRLVPAHRVIAVDLPGHGKSDRPDDGYDFDTVSRDLEGLLAGLHHPEPLVVVGHSWGATVALSFAATYPDLALGVVCVDGGAGDLKAYFGPSWEVAER
ncbi:MAG: alpha/beta fold hydrolase, partial [Mycobacterium sp.]